MKENVRDKAKKIVTLTFDSALEAHQWGTAENGGDGLEYRRWLASQERGKAGDSWSGVESFQDSVELAANGWESGTSAILGMVKQIEARDDVAQHGYDWDVTGDFFDVGEVIQGTPECWLTPAFEPVPRVISICVNITHSDSVTSDQIKNRGAALLALIDRIQDTQGIIVDLILHSSFGCANIAGMVGYGTINMMFPVGTSPLPMQEVSFMLAHPAMFRRGCFAVAERVGNYKPAKNYGSVVDLPGEAQADYSLYLGGRPYENGMNECNTVDGAVKWIHAQLAKMGL